MESQSNDNSSSPVDPVAAFRVAADAQAAMAARVRSPWWLHVARGLLVAAIVGGLGSGTEGSAWVLLGVVGLAALARWRTRQVGVTRADPERWRFIALGAPWSVVSFVAVVAAMVFVVVVRDAPIWQIATAAAVAGVLMAALGPVADHAARTRLSSDLAPGGAR